VGVVAERSFSSVVLDIGGNVDRIVRAELQCAVADLQLGMEAAAEASRHIIISMVCAALAAGFMLLGGMFALSAIMPTWLASLAVALFAALAAALFFAVGRARNARQRPPSSHDAGHSIKVAT
jgi:hypothetical protein